MARIVCRPLRFFDRAVGSLPACVLALALASAAALVPSRADAAPKDKGYILATATTGGTFYPVGVAIATVTKTRLAPSTGISLTAISSAGSAENITLMRKNEAQFAILQGISGAWAWRGDGPQGKDGQYRNIRAVTGLWPNVEHFLVVRRLAPTGTMADLKGFAGKRFALGRRNSGAENSGRYILQSIGIDPEIMSLAYLGYGPSADALINGTLDGANIPAGRPVSAVTRAFAARGGGLALLAFSDQDLAQVNERFDLWRRHVVPAGTYPGQDEPVATIAQANVLAVRADVDEETVYQIVKTLYGNLVLLNAIHPATKDIDLQTATDGLPMPLHPGAERFFREAGVALPDPSAFATSDETGTP
ncbi:MAG: TAXI family TRAP transporter solute-binding subunit [Alphaproteobacteria bacterium]